MSATEMPKARPRFSSNIIAGITGLFDGLSLIAAVPFTLLFYNLLFGQNFEQTLHVSAGLITATNFFLLRLAHDAYTSPLGRRQDADLGVVTDFILSLALTMASLWALGLVELFSRGLIGLFAITGSVILFFSRFALRRLVARLVKARLIGQRVVIYGADRQSVDRAVGLINLERLPHLDVVGVADERQTRIKRDPGGTQFIGGIDQVTELVRRGQVDQVLIAIPKISQERLDHLLEQFGNVAVDICIMPRESIRLTSTYRVHYLGSVPLFYLWRRPLRDWQAITKAVEDRVIAALAILAVSPILLATTLAIKLTSPGPVLFVQRRFGFNSMAIDVFKFRSMYIDRQDVTGEARTQREDPRVTPVGRIIRRLSIDELPQLFNVLRGEMSIVGPRPHATAMKVGDEYYFKAVKGYEARHRVKPGITGLAQVRGLRGEIATIERARKRVEYDLYYVDNWSLALDVRIIAETIFTLIRDKNAY